MLCELPAVQDDDAGACGLGKFGSMTLSIEPVAERHFPELHAALDTVAREKRYLAFTQAPPAEQAYAFYRYILANGHCQLVALRDGQLVGWCDVLPSHGEARAHVGTLGIGLVHSARHQGIGARLLHAAIDAAWAKGFTRIALSVRADNPNAQALYARFGFEVEGRQRQAYCVEGVFVDGIAMALLRDDVQVRPFLPGEELVLRDVFSSSVHQNAQAHYTPEQLDAWAPARHDASQWADRIRSRRPFVAERGGRIVGFADLQPSGYIDMFFVAGGHAGRGIGKALMRRLHAVAAEQGIGQLFSDVSLAAEAFFAAHGFAVEQRQDVPRNGVVLRNARMRKVLMHPRLLDGIEPARSAPR